MKQGRIMGDTESGNGRYQKIRRMPGKDAAPSSEVEDEIRFHLEEKKTRLMAAGMSKDEAEAEAQRRFGDVEEVRREMMEMTNQRQDKQQRRDMWGDLRQDIRFARRHLFRSPLFTTVAALTLALGIGATTAVYSVVHGILLSPLAFEQPDELVTIWADYTRREGPLREWLSFENFHDLTTESSTLEAAAVYNGGRPTLTGFGEPQQVPEAVFSPGMFSDVLRVAPALGRLFDEREEAFGGPGAVLLSHGLWQRAFGGDPNILGRTLSLNDQPVSVVGVMGEDFRPPFIPQAQMWRPAQIDPADPPCGRGCVFLRAVGRIADGATVEQLQAEATSVGRRLEQAYPAENTGVGFYINPLQDDMVASSSQSLWILLGSVGFVLLVACVNVANLLLSRASVRRSELAVRSALGAGSPRIFRQLLTENLMLALIGGAAGLLLGSWATGVLVSLAPAGTPRIDEVGMDLGVLAAVAAVTLGAGLLFGTLPARRSSRRA
ncbi:MAG: FtsX-like permease family protein, partial [Gemmatimonadetes bacterium]|nr:FtsX-like permease family protein [Gemmatimonadota bacterium]